MTATPSPRPEPDDVALLLPAGVEGPLEQDERAVRDRAGVDALDLVLIVDLVRVDLQALVK